MSSRPRWRQAHEPLELTKLVPLAVVGMAFLIALLVAVLVGGRPALLVAETSQATATAAASSAATDASPVPGGPTPPTTVGSPAALLAPNAASPEPAAAQTFDLEPLTSSGRGWTRSDAAVGVVAFPTSVDRSLKLPAGKGASEHSACRPFTPGVEEPTRIVADLFVSRLPTEVGPLLVVGDDQAILVWSEAGISVPSAAAGAPTAALQPSTWYRVAVQITPSSPSYTWEVARIDPWEVVTLATAELPGVRGIAGERLCFVGPPGLQPSAVYIDRVGVDLVPSTP